MKRVFISIIGLILFSVALCAQTLKGNAPATVAVGEQFRLTYTVNTNDVSDFHIGQLPDVIEVIMGPSQSTQSSYSTVKGVTTKTESLTYTYLLTANREGIFTIPPAHITADGNAVTSNAITISVSGTAPQNSSKTEQQENNSQTQETGTPISDSDLFIKAITSKQRVMEQEAIVLTYKVYSTVNLTSLDGKMPPDMKNVFIKEIPLPTEKHFQGEDYNGRWYNTII